jgi:hypothetical protein
LSSFTSCNVVFPAAGDLGPPRVVNTGLKRGGENRIGVTLFDGNNDEVIPLPNAGIY